MTADTAAHEVLGFLGTGGSLATFTGRDPTFDVARGYDVLARVHATQVARGEIPIGRKIGFTNHNL